MNIPSIPLKGLYLSQLFLAFSVFTLKAQQQQPIPGVPDSLANMSYEELRSIYEPFIEKNDTLKATFYLNIHIAKAKKEKDTVELANGYSEKSFTDYYGRGSSFADSLVNLTKNIQHFKYPAYGYYLKGYYDYIDGNYKNASDYLLEALDKVDKKNKNLLRLIKNIIGALKERYGSFKEAKKINVEILQSVKSEKRFRENFYEDYMSATFNVVISNLYLKQLDEAEEFTKEAIQEAKKKNDTFWYYMHYGNLGEIRYEQKSYYKAIKILTECIPFDEGYALANTYIFRGKSYWETNQAELALQDFQKADSIVWTTNSHSPEILEVYTLLNSHYREEKEYGKQSEYIDKLIKTDSILDADALYLSKEIKDKYDIPLLLEEREDLINDLKKQNSSISQ